MSDRRSSSDLGASAEAMLSAFPLPERDWESDARQIEARLVDSLRGSTDALLLAAPLPSEAEEPSLPSASATPLTNSGVRTQSLAEIARRSLEKKQASERQMARDSLALAAQQRQRSGEAHAVREAMQSQTDAQPAAASVSGARPIGARASTPPVVASNHWPKVALALPALALAAATLFWFRQPEPAPLLTNGVASAAASAVAPGVVAASAVANHPAPAAEDPPHGIDPTSLPSIETLALDEATPAADPARAPGGVIAAAPAKADKPARKGERAAPAANVVDQSLPPDPTLRPADSRGGDLPAKPTTGAVQAALGAVLSGARHCVAGDDSPSTAVVVFGSDGRVQHVTVKGPAAGKSSASCIEAQLGRARVQPFAASNFSVSATVRPE